MRPSAVSARLEPYGAATIETTLLRYGGGVAWPAKFTPKPTTVPFPSSARLCAEPAEVETTFDKFNGGEACPNSLYPQPTTVPSLFSARPWKAPADTLTTSDNPGGIVAAP